RQRRAWATLGSCGARRRSSASVAQIAAGELEEYILEARWTVQVAQLMARAQRADERRRICGVDERGVARTLHPGCEPARVLQPAVEAAAVHFDHLRRDVLG